MSTRNIIRIEQYYRFHEITGQRLRFWRAYVLLGSSPARSIHLDSRGFILRQHAIQDLREKINAVKGAATRALARLDKVEKA